MRSALRFLSVGALGADVGSVGRRPEPGFVYLRDRVRRALPATSQSVRSQGSSSGSDGQYLPEKPEKNAPPKDTMDNIDAIGNRNVGCNKGMGNWYSLDKQVAMGRSYSQQVEHGAKMVNDPVVTEYVNRIGQNLVRNSDAKVPFTIKVIDTDEINAFALARRLLLCELRPDSGGRQ